MFSNFLKNKIEKTKSYQLWANVVLFFYSLAFMKWRMPFTNPLVLWHCCKSDWIQLEEICFYSYLRKSSRNPVLMSYVQKSSWDTLFSVGFGVKVEFMDCNLLFSHIKNRNSSTHELKIFYWKHGTQSRYVSMCA